VAQESSSLLALGAAFGLLPPKEQVMNAYTFQFLIGPSIDPYTEQRKVENV